MPARLQVDAEKLAVICRNYNVRRLALFGSAARGELRPNSDVDVLIEFDPNHRPGMVGLDELEHELSLLYGCRKVDMVNPKYLNRRIRASILAEAQVQWTASPSASESREEESAGC